MLVIGSQCPEPQLCQIVGKHVHGHLLDLWHGRIADATHCDRVRRSLAPHLFNRGAVTPAKVVEDRTRPCQSLGETVRGEDGRAIARQCLG